MSRVHNFTAGPAALPLSVLEKAQAEFIDYQGTGKSILETSHRSDEFDAMFAKTKQDLRELMQLDDSQRILFLSGGASTQFSMIPYNFLKANETAGYIDTGTWSTNAIKEAKKFGKVEVLASSADKDFSYIPYNFSHKPELKYLHLTSNNTIRGTQWSKLPDIDDTFLVCDMSSDFLGIKRDYSKFGIIYAGAQKNIGPSGVTVVIIRDELLEYADKEDLMTMMDYNTHVDKDSLYNTPPVFPIYMVGLVAEWLKEQGGVEAIEEINRKKAELLYSTIDTSNGFYTGTAKEDSRSIMNITFLLKDESLEAEFSKQAKELGIIGIEGHRSVGGFRASLYNAVTHESVEVLTNFMRDFASTH